jgi:hypothetical protein
VLILDQVTRRDMRKYAQMQTTTSHHLRSSCQYWNQKTWTKYQNLA